MNAKEAGQTSPVFSWHSAISGQQSAKFKFLAASGSPFGVNLSYEGCQHLLYLDNLGLNSVMHFDIDEMQVLGEETVVLQFTR